MPPTAGETPLAVFWNEANGVVQDHRDGTIDWEATDRERLARNMPAMVRPTALDRAIKQRDLEAKAEELGNAIRSEKGSQHDSKTAEINALIVADKELRRDLDAQLQKLKSLKPSREHSLAITKLQEAIMWLGMSLKSLNDTRPYPSSYDPSTTKVEPTADGLKL